VDAFKASHKPLISQWGARWSSPIWMFAECLFLYPLILLLSWVLYRSVEKPFVRIGQQLWNRSRA
ncbi:MAG: hypothetical protein VKO44_11355, partial [Cyanobacteriota bacterium]|nr:hypothetical protein [Cyanobacteriota bacterium]